MKRPCLVALVLGAAATIGCGDAFSSNGSATAASSSGSGGTGGESASATTSAVSGTGGAGGDGQSSVATATTGTGAGGTGGGCVDADADGQTDCEGDCNDNDPTVYLGGPEICGDGLDQNCDGDPDEVSFCQGLGTFVSVNGNNANPGTQALPVQTIAVGLARALTIGNGVDVYVAQGIYYETVTLVEGVSLFGGYEDVGWTRDIKANTTSVACTAFVCLSAPSTITRATVFDGFSLKGLTGAPAAAPGNATVYLQGGCPTITHNIIQGGVVSGGSGSNATSSGVFIVGPQPDTNGPLIAENTISGGTSTELSVGVLISDDLAAAEIRDNSIRGAAAKTSHGLTAWASTSKTLVENNDIQAGDSTTGGSFGVVIQGAATINKNRINTDLLTLPKCTQVGSGAWCGGLLSFSATATVTNNVILGADSIYSAGVLLSEAEDPAGQIILNSNYIDGVGQQSGAVSNTSRSVGLVLRSPYVGASTHAIFGSIRNNIFVAGRNVNRYGVYEDDVAGQTCDPLAFENNDIFFPFQAGAINAYYRDWNGTVGTPYALIDTINVWAGFGANIDDDPHVDQSGHLLVGSPCINAGTMAEAPLFDMDDESRPKGATIDIGADEKQ